MRTEGFNVKYSLNMLYHFVLIRKHIEIIADLDPETPSVSNIFMQFTALLFLVKYVCVWQ